MLARVCSAALNGIEAYPVEVEVNAGYGDTLVVIVGLPDAAVKESRDRVSTALTNSGFKFPMGRTTINLAPADVKKEGPSFDLPIAVGMLAASEQIETDQLDNFIIVGELALTGAVRPCKGVLPVALRAQWMTARCPTPSWRICPRRPPPSPLGNSISRRSSPKPGISKAKSIPTASTNSTPASLPSARTWPQCREGPPRPPRQ